MPLRKARKGSSKKRKQSIASSNISEFHKGKTYARTARKFGKETANKQAIAAGMHAAGLSKRRSPMKMRSSGEDGMKSYARSRGY